MISLAFFIGLLSSVHCVGMCGPLMFTVLGKTNSFWSTSSRQLLYQFGRITSYSMLGFALGLLGASIQNGWQQQLSLFTGVVLLFFGVYQLIGRQIPAIARRQQLLVTPVLEKMAYWLQKPRGHFMVGCLNGLLPCGMVYLALASALNTGTALRGSLFMLFFGLGTLPLMLGAAMIGSTIKGRLKLKFTKWMPALLILFGLWFVLRGANLGIPYLSPIPYSSAANDILCK
ncbi:sulfite exporter TauE/SafE family protein [Olivibacter ginsenosidimutans]|uniref:Sulfite exporter TauE/SafE family protein n=1 Tax=Olivibacter ginsenosidimutans TaxID=1176537 RepID=A0ABP9BHY3_9SPHI